MTAPDIAQIARSLTKAQRDLLIGTGICVESYPPAKKLIALNLACGRYSAMGTYRMLLTPTGLAVRDWLKENGQ